jgi:hypothetical protein
MTRIKCCRHATSAINFVQILAAFRILALLTVSSPRSQSSLLTPMPRQWVYWRRNILRLRRTCDRMASKIMEHICPAREMGFPRWQPRFACAAGPMYMASTSRLHSKGYAPRGGPPRRCPKGPVPNTKYGRNIFCPKSRGDPGAPLAGAVRDDLAQNSATGGGPLVARVTRTEGTVFSA